MKRKYGLIILCLLFSLFIYLFYRTEKTVVTQLFIAIIPFNTFAEWRSYITTLLPLNEHIIYSLPEGLWVFSITLTSESLSVHIYNFEINLLFMPLVFSIGLELLQLFHLTNGRFDFWDIGISLACWAIAAYLVKHKSIRQNILHPFSTKSLTCVLSYLVVYLAHVGK